MCAYIFKSLIPENLSLFSYLEMMTIKRTLQRKGIKGEEYIREANKIKLKKTLIITTGF